jgi:LPS-assembly protein
VLLPWNLGGWVLTPELAARETWYGSRLLPVGPIGQPFDQSINRRAIQGMFEIRPPAIDRVFNGTLLGHKIKHVIEPRVLYQYTNGVDNFANILRFDGRDILSNTNELEYAVVNRLYAKRAGCEKDGNQKDASVSTSDCAAREIVSWELAQKYFFDPNFGGALVVGRPNVFTTTEELTGITFLTAPRRFSPIVSRLRMRAPKTDVEWNLDYDTVNTRINSSMALVDYKFLGAFHIGGGHAYLQTPVEIVSGVNTLPVPSKFNQFRVLAAYGNPSKPGFSLGGSIGYDIVQSSVQYSAIQSSYNWDCCGVTFEYRRFALGSIRNENQFRFALSLLNVGTFGTLRRQERLF